MVRQIERLGPEFDLPPFIDGEQLGGREIKPNKARTNQRIAALIASLVCRLKLKRVDIPIASRVTQDRVVRGTRLHVWPLMHRVVHRIEIAGAIEPLSHLKRVPTLHINDVVELPFFQQKLRDSLPRLRERQFV